MGERFGRFEVHESLATSDIATLHRAEVPGADGAPMEIALRRLRPQAAANQEAMSAFVREAQLGMHLQHPNITRIYELGNLDGTIFTAMELVRGKSLAELLVEGMTSRQIPVPVVLAILRQVLDALEYAHGLCDQARLPLGIIHGELSPSNVTVSDSGIVKVVSFGRSTTRPADGYMAPEYVSAGMRDARADLFALGVIAHEMLANRPLFTGATAPETLERITGIQIPSLAEVNPAVPPELDAILQSALSRDPNYRWQYAGQLRDGIVGVAQHYGLEIPPDQVAAWMHTPPPAPPPRNAFSDDGDDEATQIRQLDPELLAMAAAAGRPQDLVAPRPRQNTPRPQPAAQIRQSAANVPRPVAPAPRPSAGSLPVAPAPRPSAGRLPKPESLDLAPPAEPEPPPPEPPPPEQPPPRNAFEPEMGPEPTQIGAMPLITFGDTTLAALVGENAPRVSSPSVLPNATGTSAPNQGGPKTRDRRLPIAIAIGAAILLVVIILIAR